MSFPISQIISSLHDLLCLEQSKVSETKRCMRFCSPGEEWPNHSPGFFMYIPEAQRLRA